MSTESSTDSIGKYIFVSHHFLRNLFLQICEEYERMTGHSLEEAIKNEFSGDILVRFIQDF